MQWDQMTGGILPNTAPGKSPFWCLHTFSAAQIQNTYSPNCPKTCPCLSLNSHHSIFKLGPSWSQAGLFLKASSGCFLAPSHVSSSPLLGYLGNLALCAQLHLACHLCDSIASAGLLTALPSDLPLAPLCETSQTWAHRRSSTSICGIECYKS